MAILITGGAGFIGANFVLDWLAQRRRTEAEWRDEREGQIVLCRYTHMHLAYE